MSVSAQEMLKRLDKEQSPAERKLAELSGSATLDVNTSPLDIEPATTKTFGGGLVPEFDVDASLYTPEEREAASRGVDITTELRDSELRSDIGFSPNEHFTADYLSRKLAEKTGLPAEQLVRFNGSGGIEFYNPDTKRFTPVDSNNFTTDDLRDFYGPATSIAPPVVGAIAGGFAGPGGSITGGGTGAFLGEIARLRHGREIGVHDLGTEEILDAAMKAAAIDVAFGTGGQIVGELRRLGRKLLKPEGFTPEEATNILENVGKHKDELARINDGLEAAGKSQKFILDPVADAEDLLGLEMREAAAKTSQAAKSARAAEIKANNSALDEYAKVIHRIDIPEGEILSREGAGNVARPAQKALREERQRVESYYDSHLRVAEDEARLALDQLGTLSKAEGGERARGIVAAHADELEQAKNINYQAYAGRIGQKTEGEEGFTEAARYISDVKVPVNQSYVDYQKTAATLRSKGLLTGKAQGKEALKTMKVGEPVDLAILDDNIKELRDILRRGDPGFSTRKVKLAKDQLVKLRNDYLSENNPEALDLLLKAERATEVYQQFAKEGVFKRILVRNADGNFQLDDVSVFRNIFTADDGGRMMRELAEVAAKEPGGLFGLQATALQFYKANVTQSGSNILSKAKHDIFIDRYGDTLSALFNDPKMLKFGKLEAAVATARKRNERVLDVLRKSELGRLGSIAPERMGRAVFNESVSEKGLRQTMLALDAASPEAAAAFRDSVGRDVYRRITTDGVLNPAAITNLIENQGGKLTLIFGETYRADLRALYRMIKANSLTVSGKELPATSLIGRFARAIVTPPLTRRGRMQTWLEAFRKEGANEIINQAVRDPRILRAIVANAERDVTSSRVLNLLGQIGGLSLAHDDPLRVDE